MEHVKSILESNNFIVLNKYLNQPQPNKNYQSEAELEREFIKDLELQGYEYMPNLTNYSEMLSNIREQLQALNNVQFSNTEWARFVQEYLDKPNDGILDKTDKIHNNHLYDFKFDNGHIKNICLLDKKVVLRNKVQIISQFTQTGTHTNRYDVTILVNGLPLVHVELKKRGVAIREAFNQIHRYSKESFNSENSLYKYLQIFVISNGTDSRYFANTTKRDKDSFEFTMNWARSDNTLIKDLKDFTATFFQKNTLLQILLHYSVFDVSKNLLIMRPYQIAATERILWKIKSSNAVNNYSNSTSGGYIWHTTGSGKTLTSFKAARLITELECIDKVLFVVDRKDLDTQAMQEYERFAEGSVNISENTAKLKLNIESNDNKIVITTIQKLNRLIKSEENLTAYNKQIVFIFDECHRSQFGEAQKNIKKQFKKFYQFGFTGTPIFAENSYGTGTTASIFGYELHSYVITDAIRDEKVLKFKVDYNNVRPKFKQLENEQDQKKLTAAENKQALLHKERIKEISKYILNVFKQKTHRLYDNTKGFSAMFAVSSIEAAKLYYETLNNLQIGVNAPLKIATIFSFAANEEQSALGDIEDEGFDVSALNSSSKEFLSKAINDYNKFFNSNYSVDNNSFQKYYQDLANKVKNKEIDLLIVVGMFLTGFDAPKLNTLFVDKNLQYHGLIQAYSRTNRIYDASKTFGNIVTFRNLEQATIDAIKLFGDTNTRNVVLEKSYKEYMEGFEDTSTGKFNRGFVDIVHDLEQQFPNPQEISTDLDKKNYVKLFNEYLRVENILQNYDEFNTIKEFKNIDINNKEAVETFKEKHYVSNDELAALSTFNMPEERKIQDYKSTYNDIRDWVLKEKLANNKNLSTLGFDGLVFEVDLLKSQEINLDYILEQLFEKNQNLQDKTILIEDIRRIVRSSIDNRTKESLLVDFINKTDLNTILDKATIIANFNAFAIKEQQRELDELISSENLDVAAAKRYIKSSLKRGFASENGTELASTLSIPRLTPEYLIKKQIVYKKISNFVEKFKGIAH